MKRNLIVLFTLLFFTPLVYGVEYVSQNLVVYDNNPRESRYDYIYQNPPRQSLGAYGRYIYSNSSVRYVHSPSRLKNAAHAARINAYNRMYAY